MTTLKMQQLMDKYRQDIQTLRSSGSSRVTASLKHGIQARPTRATEFIPSSDLEYWRDMSTRGVMESRLDAYFVPQAKVINDEVSDRVWKWIQREYSCGDCVRPIPIRQAFKEMPQDTSPGFPFTRAGIKQKRDTQPFIFGLVKGYMKRGLWNDSYELPPCVAQSRNSLRLKPENKPRLVWAYPMLVSILEYRFASPISELLQKCSLLAWDVNYLNGGTKTLWNKFHSGETAKIGGDFSGLDASIPAATVRKAFDICRNLLSFETSEDKKLWSRLVDYFVDTPIYFYNQLAIKKRGVPSGSCFTQIIDSIVTAHATLSSLVVLVEARIGYRIESLQDLVIFATFLGDDSLINLRFRLHFDDDKIIHDICFNRTCLTFHPSKGFFYPTRSCAATEDGFAFEFLGKQFLGPTICTIDDELLLAQLLLPENPDKDPGDAMTRIVGLVWSCGTSIAHYIVLQKAWKHLTDVYPKATPTPFRRDISDFFEYVMHSALPPLRFPDRLVVLGRYLHEIEVPPEEPSVL